MKFRHKILTPLLIVLTLFVTLVIPAYAWFDNTFGMSYDLLGKTRASYTSYFAKGTGTELDPYVIAEAEHLYNLSYLQNLGKFQTQTTQQYFKVADLNGNTIDIDFTDYHALPPIGNHDYPFTGIFNGNNSNLINITIDGVFNQDIGLFGFMKGFDSDNDGDYDLHAKVENLFMENPMIISNPDLDHVDYSTVGFHPHNDGTLNHATGYIVGHLGSFAILENVFVEAATIDSFSNAASNRSEYGLIGYNQTDSGYIAGGPRSPYTFSFNMANTYTALSYALSTYGTYYVVGETPAKTLSQVLITATGSVEVYGKAFNRTGATFNYSISTLRIYDPNETIDEAFNLYDRLRELGYSFATSQSAEYSKENMDLVGSDIFYSTGSLQMKSFVESLVTPLVGSTFNPHAYPAKFLLYAKVPTDPLAALGWITSVYGGSGDLAYYTGFDDITGDYEPGVAPTANSFASSGVRTEMEEALALAAIQKSENGEMIVVDPNNPLTPPDFYVFLVGVFYDGTPKNMQITSIQFEYQPQALEISSSLSAMQNVDFIHDVDTVRSNLATYSFSYLNFGYSLTPVQRLSVSVVRTTVNLTDPPGSQTFTIYIDYEIDDLSEFYFDIINLNNYTIVLNIRYGNTGNYIQRYSGTHDVILTEISASTIVVDPYNTT
jgi:hypothetical protein